jgi:hypothetical protein
MELYNSFNTEQRTSMQEKGVKKKEKEKDVKKKEKVNQYTYSDKLRTISSYFGVSMPAAKYLFHRRRCGMPYKGYNMPNFLPWSFQLQNALVKADVVPEWDWGSLEFDTDITTLSDYGLNVVDQSKTIYRAPSASVMQTSNDATEWTVVERSPKKTAKYRLRRMGFLPRGKPKKRSEY